MNDAKNLASEGHQGSTMSDQYAVLNRSPILVNPAKTAPALINLKSPPCSVTSVRDSLQQAFDLG